MWRNNYQQKLHVKSVFSFTHLLQKRSLGSEAKFKHLSINSKTKLLSGKGLGNFGYH